MGGSAVLRHVVLVLAAAETRVRLEASSDGLSWSTLASVGGPAVPTAGACNCAPVPQTTLVGSAAEQQRHYVDATAATGCHRSHRLTLVRVWWRWTLSSPPHPQQQQH